jgi:phage FluMu protein Com
MIEQECPHCGEVAEFSELYLGRRRSCPNCGKKMPVGEIQEEAKTIPWKRILPGLVAGLVIVLVIASHAKRIIPKYRSPEGAHLRCLHCDRVLPEQEPPGALPIRCPRCGLWDIYLCNERCAQCGRVHFFGHGKVVNNCRFCGSTEFTPLGRTQASDAPPPARP